MPPAVPISLARSRFKQLAQRSNEVWQGAVVRMPMWIAPPDRDPWRPTGAVWVSARTGLVHVDLLQEGEEPAAGFALRTLLDFGLKHGRDLGGRPARVEVPDRALGDALAELLRDLSTEVVVAGDLPAVRDVLIQLENDTGSGRRMAGLLEVKDLTAERLRAFAAAAAAFYEARLWDHLANDDLIVVEGDGVPGHMRHVVILGHGGEQFGIAFFPSRAAFSRVIDAAEVRSVTNAYGITFGRIDELPIADADAWLDLELPVGGRLGYPLIADIHQGGRVDRPTAIELTYAEALLRALSVTTEDEIDTGRWRKRIDTFDGPATLTLSLPALIEGEKRGKTVRPSRLTRAAERGSVRVARLLESGVFASLDEVNAELERARQVGELDDLAPPGRELTKLEQAQELAYDAMEVDGRLQVKRG